MLFYPFSSNIVGVASERAKRLGSDGTRNISFLHTERIVSTKEKVVEQDLPTPEIKNEIKPLTSVPVKNDVSVDQVKEDTRVSKKRKVGGGKKKILPPVRLELTTFRL